MTTVNLGDGVVLHLEDEWRTPREQPRYASLEPRPGDPGGVHAITSAIVHHSGGATLGDPDPAQWLRNIFHFHVDGRLYSDIAYETACDEHGHLWALRDNAFVGAHTLQPGDTTNRWNRYGTAVVLLRTESGVDPQVRLALRKWYGLQCVATGWRTLSPTTHHDVDPGTECPGDDLRGWVHSPDGIIAPAPGPGGGNVPPGAPGPAPRPNPYPGFVLQQGSAGPVVRLFQQRLNDLGFGPLTVDGVFGPRTDGATRSFQSSRHLTVDGRVGPVTWAAAW